MAYKKHLESTISVIEFLGGNKAVAELLDADEKAVANWRYFEVFPANTYVALKHVLRLHGRTAPDELWTMRPLHLPKNYSVTLQSAK